MHPLHLAVRSLLRGATRPVLAALFLGFFLAGPVLETGCGSSGNQSAKKRKPKKKRRKPKKDLDIPESEDPDSSEPTVDSREEERRVREAWEAKQKAAREQEAGWEEEARKAAEEEVRRRREKEEARIRAEEERKRRVEEEARRKELEAANIGKELKALVDLEPELGRLAAKLEFLKAIEILQTRRNEFQTRGACDRCVELIEHQKAMNAVFEKMFTRLEPGTKIQLGPGFTLTVEKADREGIRGKVGRASLPQKWIKFDKAVLLSLFDWEEMDADDEFGIGLLAYAFGLAEEAEKHLLNCIRLNPRRARSVGALVAAARGTGSESVLIPYRGMWVTGEEKKYIDEGKEKYNGRWMTQDEVMKAKGFIKHEGRWLTQEEYEKETEGARKLEKLKKKLAPKGLIDKKGADSENLEWYEKRVFKSPWGNYTIHSNLSMDAIKDIAYMMEWLQWNFRKIFRIRRKMPKYAVNIAKNKAEYDSDLGGGGLGHCGGGHISTFYQPPNTTMVLMHEGTHQMIFKFAPCTPTWLHEAFATYFECSKFEVNPKTKTVDLKTGLLNKWRLGHIQREMKTNGHTPLREQIKGNIGGLKMYHQGWALSYYMIKGNGGKYAPRYFYYLEKFAGKGGQGRKKGQPEDKQVMRFMKALGIYDMDAFEKDWMKFILSLDLKKGEDFDSGHR